MVAQQDVGGMAALGAELGKAGNPWTGSMWRSVHRSSCQKVWGMVEPGVEGMASAIIGLQV